MDLGDKIKALRIKQGLTLEEVGNRVGVGKSTVRKWESGKIANMRRDKIASLANALNVSPAYLMGWDDLKRHPVSDMIRDRISAELSNVDPADIAEARTNMNVEVLDKIIGGCDAITIDDALEASDMLGVTIDDLLGIEESAYVGEPNAEREEVIRLFAELDPANQSKLIDYAQLLLTAQQAGCDS